MRVKFFVVCSVLLLFSAGCIPNMQKVECPDGNMVIMEDAENLFPVYVPVYEMGLKAYLDNLTALEQGADPEFMGKIVTLRDKANQETSKYRVMLQTAFSDMQKQPCDIEQKIKFYELVAKINKRGEDLYKIGQQRADLELQETP